MIVVAVTVLAFGGGSVKEVSTGKPRYSLF